MLTVMDLQKSSKFHKFSHFSMSFNVTAAILYKLHSP